MDKNESIINSQERSIPLIAWPKRYLLTAGDNYYPCSGTEDWIDFFDSYDEAKKEVEQMMDGPKYKDSYKIRDKFYDWYEIIDLLNWKDHV